MRAILRLAYLSPLLLLDACGGRVDGEDDAAPSRVAPQDLPACPGRVTAPADRAPTDAKLFAAGSDLTAVGFDDTTIYFASANESEGWPLRAIPKAGGTPRVLGRASAYQLVVDEENVLVGTGGGVWAHPKAGGEGKGIAPLFSFAVDGEFIYGTNVEPGNVSRRNKDGKEETILAVGHGSQGVSVYDGYVYWANYPDNTVARVRTTGGPAEPVGTFPTFTRGAVADCHYVYVSVGNYGDQVYRVPVKGGPPELLVDVGGSLALDTMSLYVQNRSQTVRVSLQTGKVTSLGEGHGRTGGLPQSIVVDSDAVYWVTARGLMRATK